MKHIRYKNRLEKLIQAEIKKECKPRNSALWGTILPISPAFVDTGRGDRKQLVWLKTMDSRPDYYVLRVDSKEDVTADEYNMDEMLLQPIEELYDNVDRYAEDEIDGKRVYRDKCEDEIYPESYVQFPMLSWSGGWWGVIKNFNPSLRRD